MHPHNSIDQPHTDVLTIWGIQARTARLLAADGDDLPSETHVAGKRQDQVQGGSKTLPNLGGGEKMGPSPGEKWTGTVQEEVRAGREEEDDREAGSGGGEGQEEEEEGGRGKAKVKSNDHEGWGKTLVWLSHVREIAPISLLKRQP